MQGDRIIRLPIFVGHGIFIDTEIRRLNIIPSITSVTFIIRLCFQKWYSLVANARGLPPPDRTAIVIYINEEKKRIENIRMEMRQAKIFLKNLIHTRLLYTT